MSFVYGFLDVNKFYNTQLGVNPIGQLSPIGRTYGPLAEYSANVSDAELIIFNPQDTPLATNAMLDSLATALGQISGYVSSQSSILNDIILALGNNFSAISIGSIIYNPIDAVNYPSSLSFTYTLGGHSVQFKIWLANTNFINEYPVGTIRIVTPIANLSDLHNHFATSKSVIDALTPLSITNQIASLSLNNPPTGMFSETFRVFNYSNSSQWFDLPVVFLYNGGPTFCNPTNTLAAFVQTLVSSGTLTLEQWESIIPSLVPTDKFYIIPNWNNLAVSIGGNIGSPTLDLWNNPSQTIQADYFPDLTLTQVNSFLDYTVLQFGSYGVFCLPDLSNADGRLTFRNKFEDYFMVPANDILISKMSVDTQNAITLLTNLVVAAQDPLVVSNLPTGTRLEVRNGHSYLVGVVGFISFAVLIAGG